MHLDARECVCVKIRQVRVCVSSTCWIGLGGPCFDNVRSQVRVCSSQVTGQLNIGDEPGTRRRTERLIKLKRKNKDRKTRGPSPRVQPPARSSAPWCKLRTRAEWCVIGEERWYLGLGDNSCTNSDGQRPHAVYWAGLPV